MLDAGSGIRALGLRLAAGTARIDIVLTHLHLDHIQGLMFFAPLIEPDAEIVVWGPPATEPLPERLARYLSPRSTCLAPLLHLVGEVRGCLSSTLRHPTARCSTAS